MPNYNGQQINTEHSDGLSVSQAWVKALLENEKTRPPLTDAEISAKLAAMFPDRPAHVFDDVNRARAAYNRGGLACQHGAAPRIKSHKYKCLSTPEGAPRWVVVTPRGSFLKGI
jgi:hypothetical protein